MAESKTHPAEHPRHADNALARREREPGGLLRRSGGWGSSPFEFMDRMVEEMDRTFDRMFRDIGRPRRSWLGREPFGVRGGPDALWAPRIEAFLKGDRFIVRAELPGLKKEDVQVEMNDDAITIQGERREEREEEREGAYHSEREYGRFYRRIPLPEGVIAESAQASFRDGVLEIAMQAPPAEAARGRRLEIKDASESGGKK